MQILHVVTDAKVAKINFDGKKAVCVQLQDGRKCKQSSLQSTSAKTQLLLTQPHPVLANKEIILAAGSIDTPKILLLSGIGPSKGLASHHINVVKDLPGIGKNLADHIHVFMGAEMTPEVGLMERYKFDADPQAIQAAREQWSKDGTGPVTLHNSSLVAAWLKLPSVYESKEFRELDALAKRHMSKETVPSYEIILGGPKMPPTYEIAEGTSYLSLATLGMNMQSKGKKLCSLLIQTTSRLLI